MAGIMIPVLIMVILIGMPAFAAGNFSDRDIRDAIEDQIALDTAVHLEGIDVAVNEGVVTLSGIVDNILNKDRATKIAKMVKGVRAVVNEIRVVPSILRSDVDILNDVDQALLRDPATDSYEITPTVKDNIVTLSGIVESWQERQLAETVAKGVKGVTGVVNDIDITFERNRPAMEIKRDIEAAMRWNVLLDHALIDVSVGRDGKVMLSGTVGSAIEKDEAYNCALVTGVQSVDTTGLEVKGWARNNELAANKYAVKSDAALKEAIKDAFLYDPRVFAFKITVDVENGAVTLRGAVDNLKAKRAAANDARNTVGVYAVKNRIKVTPFAAVSDEKIEKSIRRALISDPVADAYEVSVNATNGIVDLYGTVDTYYEKAVIDDIAARTNGVLTVDNNIMVNESHSPYAYDPYLDDWYVYDYDWYTYTPGVPLKPDATIEEDIESELFWSPFVDADDVSVDVDNGIATLTGDVDSWSEFYAAQKNALDGGAVYVKNKLDVESTSG